MSKGSQAKAKKIVGDDVAVSAVSRVISDKSDNFSKRDLLEIEECEKDCNCT